MTKIFWDPNFDQKMSEFNILADYVRAHKKKDYKLTEKAMAMKVKKVDKVLWGPKHKIPERCAIFDPKTEELITDENEILATTLKYNIGVLTKNKVATQDLPEVREKNILHEEIMSDQTKGEPLSLETYTAVLKHLTKKNKNIKRVSGRWKIVFSPPECRKTNF